MIKTLDRTVKEIETLLMNYERNIQSAYEKSGFELKLDIKVEIKRKGQANEITPELSFYPMPKTKSEKYTVAVDSKQIQIAGMS